MANNEIPKINISPKSISNKKSLKNIIMNFQSKDDYYNNFDYNEDLNFKN